MAKGNMVDATPRIWQVGALCRAVADALDVRFNPVAVRGEISGFSRASSGHCYFSIKDLTGQIRCVMFKRAAALANLAPRDGELVEIRGRLGLYEPRGDLQLIVESMTQAGLGAFLERFMKLKTKLEAEGLFDAARKRLPPSMPRGIGVVTSLGAAALGDVVSALQRRVPHIPVVLAVASVQGANAPAELRGALETLYTLAMRERVYLPAGDAGSYHPTRPRLDVILLVRGGGSIEDLWAFNDESLARVIAQSPVPLLSGVGHETDFTIADFVADLRAPTPTAAAELAAMSRESLLASLDANQARLQDALLRKLDSSAQRLDTAASRLVRPSTLAAVQRAVLAANTQRLRHCAGPMLTQKRHALQVMHDDMTLRVQRGLSKTRERLERSQLRLSLLDPSLVLQRGYAWLTNEHGRTITSPAQARPGSRVSATLAGGTLDLRVPTRG